jgi:hypothetical protein
MGIRFFIKQKPPSISARRSSSEGILNLLTRLHDAHRDAAVLFARGFELFGGHAFGHDLFAGLALRDFAGFWLRNQWTR